MKQTADSPTLNGQFARGLRALGAYAFGWVIAFAASALSALLMGVTMLNPPRGNEQGLLPSWLLMGVGWIAVAGVGAYLITVVGRRQAAALGLVAAFGGLSALFVPLLVYGFPLPVFGELWFEALVLGVCLPTAVFALSKWCRV